MQKKYLKIMVFVLLVVGVVISVNLSVCPKMDWGMLMSENVEALTTPETEYPYYPCVHAKGYCFANGIGIDGILLIDKE